jgi:hypothetical protein
MWGLSHHLDPMHLFRYLADSSDSSQEWLNLPAGLCLVARFKAMPDCSRSLASLRSRKQKARSLLLPGLAAVI